VFGLGVYLPSLENDEAAKQGSLLGTCSLSLRWGPSHTNGESAMKKFALAAAIAAAAMFTSTPSNAQIGFGVPGFGVHIGGGGYHGGGPHYGGGYGYGGGPYYGSYGYATPYSGGYREYEYDEGPVVMQRRVYSGYGEPIVRRRVYRERPVSMRGCRTVTVQRPNGSLKRVRSCG
jgi:hypothetical protein